jgi:hypothetical protein
MIGLLALLLGGCGDSNVADCENGMPFVPCSKRTTAEDARIALDAEDFERASELYGELISEDPENYSYYPLRAAALAGKAGLDIFSLARKQAGGGGGVFDLVGQFLPSEAELGKEGYDASVVAMGESVDLLSAIPADLRSATSADKFASSVNLQLTLYQTCYSVMYLNKFVKPGADGKPDPEALAQMSEEDAVEVITNFAQAAQASGSVSPEISAQISEVLAELENDPSGSKREQLINYIRDSKQQQGGSGGSSLFP